MNIKLKFSIVHILTPLFLGVVIYSLWRGIPLVHSISLAPYFMKYPKPPDWILYNLPDGLWMYSFLSSLLLIWNLMISKRFFIWLFIAISTGFVLEILQGINVINGTFDWFDIIAYLVSFVLFSKFLIFKHLTKIYYEKF